MPQNSPHLDPHISSSINTLSPLFIGGDMDVLILGGEKADGFLQHSQPELHEVATGAHAYTTLHWLAPPPRNLD